MKKKSNFEKIISVINSWRPEVREKSSGVVELELQDMSAAIRREVESALLVEDGFRAAMIHGMLKTWMDAIERSINAAKSVSETVDDGEMQLTLKDGRTISAQRTIRREV